jgi:hypothetical protein
MKTVALTAEFVLLVVLMQQDANNKNDLTLIFRYTENTPNYCRLK